MQDNRNRRSFLKSSFSFAALAVLPSDLIIVGCAKFQSALEHVIAALPVAGRIAQSIVTIYTQFDPADSAGLSIVVARVTGEITADFKLLYDLLEEYKSNLTSASPSTIEQADAAVAQIQNNLDALTTAFHLHDPKLKSGIAVAVAGVESILLALTGFLQSAPTKTQVQAPRSMAISRSRSAGVEPFTSGSVSRSNFNRRIQAAGFGRATI